MDFIRQYSAPFLLALLVHMVAVMGLYANWNPAERESRIIEPQVVQSKLIVMEPEAKPAAPKPAAPKPAAPQPTPAAETKPPPPEPKETQPQPDREAERRQAEETRRQAEEAARERARQERLEALAQSAFRDALADEAETLAQADTSEEEAAAQSYRNGIYQAVVANWSRPPSARNNMQAKLLVELVPTGDVVGVTVLESSGNTAFDRSAEAAVRKAKRFEVPEDPDLFEEHFRRFSLLFRPEDLLR